MKKTQILKTIKELKLIEDSLKRTSESLKELLHETSSEIKKGMNMLAIEKITKVKKMLLGKERELLLSNLKTLTEEKMAFEQGGILFSCFQVFKFSNPRKDSEPWEKCSSIIIDIDSNCYKEFEKHGPYFHYSPTEESIKFMYPTFQ